MLEAEAKKAKYMLTRCFEKNCRFLHQIAIFLLILPPKTKVDITIKTK